MDQLLFLAQDKVETLQVNLRGTSSEVGSFIKNASDGLREYAQSYSFIEKLMAGSRSIVLTIRNFNPKEAFHNVVSILVSPENRTHVYTGGICFIIGTSAGIYLGKKIHKAVVAPRLMRAVVVNNYKGLENITVVEDMVAPSITNRHQVLVRVKAAGIDYLDIKVADGYGKVLRHQLNKYNPNIDREFPVVLGRDCSGVVVSTGCDVTRVQPGEEVWLAVPIFHPGTLSEYIVVNENLVSIKPPKIPHEAIAALPYSIITAWDALVNQAGLGPDTSTNKRVLIHAGVSGVGVVALQMAKTWGAHVTTTVSTRAASLAQMLGANDIISYDNSNFNKELHLREKYDVILNTVGPLMIESCMKHCAPGGTVITTTLPVLASDSHGYFLGAIYALFLRIKYLFIKVPWITGYSMGNIEIVGTILDKVAPMISSGEILPVVDKAYSAQDAEVAFAHVAKGDQIGKTVIRFRSRPLTSEFERSC